MFRFVWLTVFGVFLLVDSTHSKAIAEKSARNCNLVDCPNLDCKKVRKGGKCCPTCQDEAVDTKDNTDLCSTMMCPPIRCANPPVKLKDDCCFSCPDEKAAETVENGPDCRLVKCAVIRCSTPIVRLPGECCDTCLADQPQPLPVLSCPLCAKPDCPESDYIYTDGSCSCPTCPEGKPELTEPKTKPVEDQTKPVEPQAIPIEPQAIPIEPQAIPTEPQAIQIEPQPMPAVLISRARQRMIQRIQRIKEKLRKQRRQRTKKIARTEACSPFAHNCGGIDTRG